MCYPVSHWTITRKDPIPHFNSFCFYFFSISKAGRDLIFYFHSDRTALPAEPDAQTRVDRYAKAKSISKTKMKVSLNYLTKSFCLTMLRCMFQVDLLLWRLVSADYNNYPSVVHCFAGELLPLKIVGFITDCFIGQLINFTQSTVFWETENSKTQY